MCSPSVGARCADRGRRCGEAHRRAGQRRGPGQAGIVDRLKEPHRLHMRIVERLLRLQHRARGDASPCRGSPELRPMSGPAHQRPMRSEISVPCSPREMSSLKRGSVSQWSSPISPAQRRNSGWPITCTRIQPSRVLKMSTGAGGLAAIAGRDPVDAQHVLLDQQAVADRQRGGQQRAFDHLTAPGLPPRHQRQHRAVGAVQRGPEVHPGRLEAVGPLAVAVRGHVGRARHDLADAVEADAVAVGPAAAVGGDHGEDDVRLDRGKAVVVELHRRKGLRRQVGDDHVGGLDQPARPPRGRRASSGRGSCRACCGSSA